MMVRDAVFEASSDGPALQAVSQHLNASPGMTSAEHLLIYRRAILGTLVRAMGQIYPVCGRLTGQQFFDAMARVYARQTPSRCADLAHFGADFCDFIANFEPAEELPYLPDVARLEWHWHRAFHAAAGTRFDFAELSKAAAVDMGRIVFRLPASATLIASDYPVHRIWQVNQAEWDGDQHVDLDQGGVRLIVWRQDHDMRIDEVDEPSWPLLNAIAEGMSLSEISALAWADELDSVLPNCVQQGWIGGFENVPRQ